MSQILVNLVSNSIKFTPAGGKVDIGSMESVGGPALFVRDTGRGIPADRLTDVLKPFVQVSDALVRDTGGVGLGLAICKSLIEAMSGRIEIASTIGQGTLTPRKGFPESYDLRRLVRFLADLKSGRAAVRAPVYSHLTYDVVPGKVKVIRQPDILILEGLGVLHTGLAQPVRGPHVFVSDFFDFSVYVHAEQAHIRQWFIERFLTFRKTAFRDPTSFFRHFASLSAREARTFAGQVWAETNGPNLRENILPTRTRANLILVKDRNHRVDRVLMRRL